MTQAIERIRFEARLLSLWSTYAEEYRIGLVRYRFLVAEKKRLRKVLDRIPVRVLKSYPDIPFFKELHEDVVKYKLSVMSLGELKKLLYGLENTIEYDTAFHVVLQRNKLFDAQVRLANNLAVKKQSCSGRPLNTGALPESCSSGRYVRPAGFYNL